MTRLLKTGSFSDRVATHLVGQVISTGLNVFNSFFFARLLGPAGKGDYFLLVLVPTSIMVLIQFGLPTALSYFTARGETRGIVGRSLLLAGAISTAALAITAVAMPWLMETILRGPEATQIALSMTTIPLMLTATFATGIVIGRQAVRWYAVVSIAQSASATCFLGALVGLLGLGVNGAIMAFAATSLLTMVGLVLGARTVCALVESPGMVRYRQLFRYGLPLYPGNIATFFSRRVDVFLLAALLAEPSAPLGFYSMAISAAEMVFLIPEAVSAVFFPHVAAAARSDSDRQAPIVARFTFFMTGIGALIVAVLATVMIPLLLPAFVPALSALYVLLPGAVLLSGARVVIDYIAGLGKTGLSSAVYLASFAVSVIANLALIPLFGITGAAAASLISYAICALAATLIAVRLAGTSPLEYWLPAPGDLEIVVVALRAMWRRVKGGATR